MLATERRWRRQLLRDPYLVLDLPFYELDGTKFMSRDTYGHLCTNKGTKWTPNGRVFDGVDDRITVANHTSFAFTTEKFTIEMGFTITDLSGARSPYGKGGGSNGYWSAVRTNGSFWFSTNEGSGAQESKSATGEIIVNTPYYFVVEKDGAAISMFKNGNKLTLATVATHKDIGANTGVLSIGDLFDGGGQFFAGTFRLFRIRKRLMTPVEIQQNNIGYLKEFGG